MGKSGRFSSGQKSGPCWASQFTCSPPCHCDSASDQRYPRWAGQECWKKSSHTAMAHVTVSDQELDGLVTTPHCARNPLQGVSWDWSHTVALLSLLSDRNSLSQDRDVEFQPSVCDSQSTVHRGQQQGDKREVPFPGGQGKYDFTEDFQGH